MFNNLLPKVEDVNNLGILEQTKMGVKVLILFAILSFLIFILVRFVMPRLISPQAKIISSLLIIIFATFGGYILIAYGKVITICIIICGSVYFWLENA